jgi:hypothetical protein
MRFTVSNDNGSNSLKKGKVREDLLKEQRKLEDMVLKMMEKGDCNLGENEKVLKQSGKLDKLIVDEMMQRETKKKRPEKG